MIESIRDTGVQDYARIGYLLGGRISENLGLLSGRVAVDNGIILAKIQSLKTRRGNYIFRELPNVVNEEPYYCEPLIRFCYLDDPHTTLRDFLGIGRKRNIEDIFKRTIGSMVPHSLRHLRATHMGKGWIPTTLHKPTAAYLKYYFGWSNIATANSYIDSLTIQEILAEHQSRSGGVG